MWARLRDFERVEDPIVKGPVHFELKGANRMRNPFDVIAEGMRPIVHRIDAPFVAGAMMRCMPDAVEHRVAQPNVRSVDIDLCPQCARAIRKLAGFHSRKQIETFIDRTVSKAAGLAEPAI